MEIIVSTGDHWKYNPIYVPMKIARLLYRVPKSQEHELVRLLFENVKHNEKLRQFELSEQQLELATELLLKRLDQEGKITFVSDDVKHPDDLMSKVSMERSEQSQCTLTSHIPGTSEVRSPISTSYLSNNSELSIKINFPSVEYTNSRKKVIVVKPMTSAEFDNFLSAYLDDPSEFEVEWPFDALKLFTSNPAFKTLESKMHKKDRLMMDSQEFQWFTLDNGLKLVSKNESAVDFMTTNELHGYFEMNNSLGKIQITPFEFSINALNGP